MEFKNKGAVRLIKAKLEDDNLLDVSKWFLKDLEEQFIKKNNDNKNNENYLKKYINNSNFIFTPETLMKKSPLTLINAPWGTGKTFFIENLLKLMIDKKIKSSVFKKMIIIDAWKFSSSKDVPMEFLKELTLKLIPANIEPNIKRAIIWKFLRKIAPSSLTFSLNAGFVGFEYTKNIDEKTQKEANEIFDRIKENKEPTIIFIDNLERLGSLSWDLLKAIIKIQEFTNFMIILPLNLNKFKNNTKVDSAEYPIEKYVDFHYYNFQQDYDNYFKKHFNGNSKLIKNLNEIFNVEINGEKLSIREVQKSFESNQLLNMDDDYMIFKKIKNCIWSPDTVFEKICKNYLETFMNYEKQKKDLLKEVSDELLKTHGNENIYMPITPTPNGFDQIISDDGKRFYYRINENYLDSLNNVEIDIETRKKELKNKIAKLNLEIDSMKNIVVENEKHNDILVKENHSLTVEKTAEEEKDSKDFDSKKVVYKQNLITANSNKIEKNNKLIKSKKDETSKLTNKCKKDSEILEKITLDMKLQIFRYKKLLNSNPLSKNTIESIYSILSRNIEDLDKKFDKYEKFDDILDLKTIIKKMI